MVLDRIIHYYREVHDFAHNIRLRNSALLIQRNVATHLFTVSVDLICYGYNSEL